MDNHEWLNELSVGDKVIMSGRYRKSVNVVQRLTKTQIILEGTNCRFRKANGREVGGSSWGAIYLRKGTPAEISKVEDATTRQRIIAKLTYESTWNGLSTKELISVEKQIDVLKEGKEKTQ